MEFTCRDAVGLVPSYMDGELSEPRAALLRKHLMDCPACRSAVQEGKALSRWFPRPERQELAAPAGFAARVSRLAFADVAANRLSDSAAAEDAVGIDVAGEAATAEGGRLLQFVLTLTAAAAGLMLLATVALREVDRPGSGRLDALNPPPSVDAVLLRLEELNRREAQAQNRPAGSADRPEAATEAR